MYINRKHFLKNARKAVANHELLTSKPPTEEEAKAAYRAIRKAENKSLRKALKALSKELPDRVWFGVEEPERGEEDQYYPTDKLPLPEEPPRWYWNSLSTSYALNDLRPGNVVEDQVFFRFRIEGLSYTHWGRLGVVYRVKLTKPLIQHIRILIAYTHSMQTKRSCGPGDLDRLEAQFKAIQAMKDHAELCRTSTQKVVYVPDDVAVIAGFSPQTGKED